MLLKFDETENGVVAIRTSASFHIPLSCLEFGFMSHAAELSVIVPVRDGQDRIAEEVQRILDAITDIVSENVEMIIVDDGSSDATPEVLDELQARYPQVRTVRHRKPLGMEVAGQTGLQQARGELVFIQEGNHPLRIGDMIRLYRMGHDPAVIAARAEGPVNDPQPPLLRRLRAWGATAEEAIRERGLQVAVAEDQPLENPVVPGLQMVRRVHDGGAYSHFCPAGENRLPHPPNSGGELLLGSMVAGGDRDQWFADRLQEAPRNS